SIYFFPPVAGAHVDPIVTVKLYIAEHPRLRVNAIRHSPLFIFVGLQHLSMKAESEKPAQTLHDGLRLAEKIFKLHTVLSLTRDAPEKLDDILVARSPDCFGELSSRKDMFVAKENLIEFGLLKGTDHSRRMPEQMYVERILKIDFGPLQDLLIERIRRRFINQDPFAKPCLQLPVTFFGREPTLFHRAHDVLRFVSVAAFDLHDGA